MLWPLYVLIGSVRRIYKEIWLKNMYSSSVAIFLFYIHFSRGVICLLFRYKFWSTYNLNVTGPMFFQLQANPKPAIISSKMSNQSFKSMWRIRTKSKCRWLLWHQVLCRHLTCAISKERGEPRLECFGKYLWWFAQKQRKT